VAISNGGQNRAEARKKRVNSGRARDPGPHRSQNRAGRPRAGHGPAHDAGSILFLLIVRGPDEGRGAISASSLDRLGGEPPLDAAEYALRPQRVDAADQPKLGVPADGAPDRDRGSCWAEARAGPLGPPQPAPGRLTRQRRGPGPPPRPSPTSRLTRRAGPLRLGIRRSLTCVGGGAPELWQRRDGQATSLTKARNRPRGF